MLTDSLNAIIEGGHRPRSAHPLGKCGHLERCAGEWYDFPKKPEEHDMQRPGGGITTMENSDFCTKNAKS
jgi:hypothetical protein